jgi:hypothetical protein
MSGRTANDAFKRREPEHDLFMTPAPAARDNRLTPEAGGILWHLLSLAANDELRPAELMKERKIGKNRMYRIIQELRAVGYLERREERDERGRIVRYVYIVSERPVPRNPHTGEPDTGFGDGREVPSLQGGTTVTTTSFPSLPEIATRGSSPDQSNGRGQTKARRPSRPPHKLRPPSDPRVQAKADEIRSAQGPMAARAYLDKVWENWNRVDEQQRQEAAIRALEASMTPEERAQIGRMP